MIAFFLNACNSSRKQPSYEQINKLVQLQKDCKTKADMYHYYKIDVHHFGFQPGQVIADIGAFDGIWDGIYSVFTDSLTFYIEDITDKGFSRCDSIMDYCARLKGGNDHSKVQKVVGTETSTNLPPTLFDKVICNESFHHFSDPVPMLNDFKKILKPGGKLYIRDSLRKKDGKKQDHFHYSMEEMKTVLQQNGFTILEDHSYTNMAFLVLEFKH